MQTSTRNTILFIVGASLIGGVYGLLQGYGESGKPEVIRQRIVESALPSCLEAARKVKAANVTDQQITQYCTCAVNKAAGSFSDEELRAIHRPWGSRPADSKQRFIDAGTQCRDQMNAQYQ